MSQRHQVIEVMEKLGGIATLGKLNQEVDVSGWRTKTPHATIRRIVQEEKYFFKIKPGLSGLNTHRERLGEVTGENQSAGKTEELKHYYYQSLLLEIGNSKQLDTFVPDQDKNKGFLLETLGKVRSLQSIHPFGYEKAMKRARIIDVIWFNKRCMPYAAFEVEHSPDFTGALWKYFALQNFNIHFYVVASKVKKREFEEKVALDEYRPIKERVKFISYDKLAEWHGNSMVAGRLGRCHEIAKTIRFDLPVLQNHDRTL